jgi:hypothetical protein
VGIDEGGSMGIFALIIKLLASSLGQGIQSARSVLCDLRMIL